ncbi:hypothetical protein IEN85_01780 [Pelagicoccus sp. NFK12]|uniref:Recombination protein O n=1 Tax=Pelagicoccus enzymogenes TaxID=2773457 RepID=A0A927F4X5_9BACT|nr:hypothetical protein [Pelagicoccus enzymogenes]MBD5778222.1 hypothetical protein [Pelagicoccus enzymogenes]MDQ8201155.1 hypothetical protein [Pelagicoccus enzymogenes]
MPAERLILAEAIVLKLTPTGEKFTQVRLLSPERGLLSVLKRNRSKANGAHIDLFDEGEAHLDFKSGENANNGFLTEFNVSKKRNGLGKSYAALQGASWLSGLLLANPMHEDELAEESFRLAARALDALSDGAPPQAVLLKTLFVFARDEGYPMVADWASKLSPALSQSVTTLLNTPLSQITLDKQEQQTAFASLSRYVEHNTHIRLPQT